MVGEHSGRLFHLNIHWLMRKGSGESGPRFDTGSFLKEQNHNFAERLKTANGLPNIYSKGIFYAFEPAKAVKKQNI